MSLSVEIKVGNPKKIYRDDVDDEPTLCITVIFTVTFQGVTKVHNFIFEKCSDGYRLNHGESTFTMTINDKTYCCDIFEDSAYTREKICERCKSLTENFNEEFV